MSAAAGAPGAPMGDDTRWALRPDAEFEWRDWDGDVVVFVTATGDVHALSPVAGLMLKTMLQHRGAFHPAGFWLDQLAGGAEAEAAEPATEAELQACVDLLRGLHHIGLVEQRDA